MRAVVSPGVEQFRFVPWEAGSAGRLRLTISAADSGAWTIQWRASESERSAERLVREELWREDDGGLVLTRTVDHVERVEVLFDPPLLVLPARLEPGQVAIERLRMTVHPLGDRSRTRAAGPVVQEVADMGHDRVRTPAGTWVARHLRSVFTADLSGTKVRNQTDQWLVDGVGLVAQKRSERTTLLGVPVRSTDEAWAILTAEPALPSRRP
jgi:hypothetical protein